MEESNQNIISKDYEECEVISDNYSSKFSNFTKNPAVQIAEKMIENPESIRATGDAVGTIITATGEAEAKVITSLGEAGGNIINAYGNSKATILDSKGRNADGLVKLKLANAEAEAKVITSLGEAGGTIIDSVGDNFNPMKMAMNLQKQRMELEYEKEKTDQIKAMTNPEFVRAVGKYKNIDAALQNSYRERDTALQTCYQKLNSSNEAERIEAMKSISNIVSSSALNELDKIESKYHDPSQDLLIDF